MGPRTFNILYSLQNALGFLSAVRGGGMARCYRICDHISQQPAVLNESRNYRGIQMLKDD
jgi:hypothetical protein